MKIWEKKSYKNVDFVAAFSSKLKALLFTGNPEFEKLEYEISIKWIAAKNSEKKMGDIGYVMGGGLYRSMGGWRAVADLRRGREAYRSDERVLGSSAFVEALLEEVDAQLKGRYRRVGLSKLKRWIAKDMGVSSHALAGGGRSENVSRARAVLCYVWMHYLGQSGRVLAEELGESPQGVYAASSRVERDGGFDSEALERWCR